MVHVMCLMKKIVMNRQYHLFDAQ
ncbi:MAG: hypothetical protein ACD_5C00233G0001, partial [uncultured bacterium]